MLDDPIGEVWQTTSRVSNSRCSIVLLSCNPALEGLVHMVVTSDCLSGRSVVILGGTSGLGLATAKAAKEAGADVAIAGRDPEKASEAVTELGGGVVSGAFDATCETDLMAFFNAIEKVDHVVSFTGEQPKSPVRSTDQRLLHRAIDARVSVARHACVHASPRMPTEGSFVFCSGVSSARPRANRSAGAVATAALESFVRAMAVELAPVRVNAVCPGAFDTDVLRKSLEGDYSEACERLSGGIPVGRVGRPEELAHAVLFLLTNTYTTGTVIRVDGGLLLI